MVSVMNLYGFHFQIVRWLIVFPNVWRISIIILYLIFKFYATYILPYFIYNRSIFYTFTMLIMLTVTSAYATTFPRVYVV
jgi:hypothetical protein